VLLVLVFPDATEFRWVSQVPRRGSRIRRADAAAVYTVTDVLRSGIATYTVHCVPNKHGRTDLKDIATDLLDRARKSISRSERKGKHYLP
jgi:hypothetical protein